MFYVQNYKRIKFILIVILAMSPPSVYASAFPSDLSGLQAERNETVDLLDALKARSAKNPSEPSLLQEVEALQLRYNQLNQEIATRTEQWRKNFQNQTVQKPSVAQVEESFQLEILQNKAQREFLKNLVHTTADKVRNKAKALHETYDNRHFLPLTKKQRSNRHKSILHPGIHSPVLEAKIAKYEVEMNSRISQLPRLETQEALEELSTRPALAKEAETQAEGLRKEIIDATYRLEAAANNVATNLISCRKLQKKLTQIYKKKIKAIYKPLHLSTEEKAILNKVKLENKAAIGRVFQDDLNGITDLTEDPIDYPKSLQNRLESLVKNCENQANSFLLNKQGIFGYRAKLRQALNTAFDASRLIGSYILPPHLPMVPTQNAPFVFYRQYYYSVENRIDTQRESVLRDLENQLKNSSFLPEVYNSLGDLLLPEHQEIVSVKQAELEQEIAAIHLRVTGRSQLDTFITRAYAPRYSTLMQEEGLIYQANKSFDEFKEHFRKGTRLDYLNDLYIAYKVKIDSLNKRLDQFDLGETRGKDSVQTITVDLSHETGNLTSLLERAHELELKLGRRFAKLESDANRTWFQLDSKCEQLKKELKLGLSDRIISTKSQREEKLRADLKSVQKLKSQLQRYIQLYDGLYSLDRTVDWAHTFAFQLDLLNRDLIHPAQTQVEAGVRALLDSVPAYRSKVEQTAERFEGSSQGGKFQDQALDGILSESEIGIYPALKKALNSLLMDLGSTRLSFEDLAQGQSSKVFGDILRNSPRSGQSLLGLAFSLTDAIAHRPKPLEDLSVSGWRSFAGMVGFPLAQVAAETTEASLKWDEFSRKLQEIQSESYPTLSGLNEAKGQEQKEDFFPPFSFVGRNAMPGLANFGANCYLNAIVKAFATTGLQKLFYPGVQLKPRDKESQVQFEARRDSHKKLSLFLSHLVSRPQYDSFLDAQYTQVLDSMGNFLKPLFKLEEDQKSAPPLRMELDVQQDTSSASSWLRIQQDADEALTAILDAYEPQMTPFWELKMAQHSHFEGFEKENTVTFQTERGLSLPVLQGFNSVQSLVQASMKSTWGGEKVIGKQRVRAALHSGIVKAPSTLLVRLNRFDFIGSRAYKIKDAVNFMEDLQLTESEVWKPYPSLHPDWVKALIKLKMVHHYQIRGVIYHLGSSTHEGHYVYAHFGPGGYITVHNDDQVNSYSGVETYKQLMAHPELREIPKNAYLLIYERTKIAEPEVPVPAGSMPDSVPASVKEEKKD